MRFTDRYNVLVFVPHAFLVVNEPHRMLHKLTSWSVRSSTIGLIGQILGSLAYRPDYQRIN
jgi:hypothetical protein